MHTSDQSASESTCGVIGGRVPDPLLWHVTQDGPTVAGLKVDTGIATSIGKSTLKQVEAADGLGLMRLPSSSVARRRPRD
jgi:hypothetical protein